MVRTETVVALEKWDMLIGWQKFCAHIPPKSSCFILFIPTPVTTPLHHEWQNEMHVSQVLSEHLEGKALSNVDEGMAAFLSRNSDRKTVFNGLSEGNMDNVSPGYYWSSQRRGHFPYARNASVCVLSPIWNSEAINSRRIIDLLDWVMNLSERIANALGRRLSSRHSISRLRLHSWRTEKCHTVNRVSWHRFESRTAGRSKPGIC